MQENLNLQLEIPETLAGQRLDHALSECLPDYSRSRLSDWLKQGYIMVNGKQWRGRDKVQGGEHVDIDAPLPIQTFWQSENRPLEIVYEDEALIVINKPAGLVVHPAAGNLQGTLLNALLHYAPELAQLPRAGIIHRIDKDTSGLLIIARELEAHTHLVAALQAHEIQREYEAIVEGTLISGGHVDQPIGRHPTHRTKMAVTANGKEAITHYRILQRYDAHTHLRLMLETGRTHQIRVHMAHIKHPIIGDPTYGGRLKIPKNCHENLVNMLRSFKRQALHARSLTLNHPYTDEELTWTVPLPDDMQQLLKALQENQHGRI